MVPTVALSAVPIEPESVRVRALKMFAPRAIGARVVLRVSGEGRGAPTSQ